MFFFTTLMIRNTIQERTKIKDGPEYQLMEYIHQNPMRSWVIKKTGFITIMAISDLVRFGELRHSETLFDQIIGYLSITSEIFIGYHVSPLHNLNCI